VPQNPVYLDGAMAFMFESTYMFRLTPWAVQVCACMMLLFDFWMWLTALFLCLIQRAPVEKDYYKCWSNLKVEFDPNNINAGQPHKDPANGSSQ